MITRANKKVVLLTGSELRHEFFRKIIANAPDIEVLVSYCESRKGNIQELVKKDDNPTALRTKHLAARTVTEEDFFRLYCESFPDQSNPIFIEKGEINNTEHVQQIIGLNPDLLIAYGCSIIRSDLLSVFTGRFINIHLGLSPYYRGSGTNFWPFVNNELQFIGSTFMHINEGIDTGAIIHQIRARIYHGDNIHQIGNRLIKDAFQECIRIIQYFSQLQPVRQPNLLTGQERYYRKKDFTEDKLEKAYEHLANGAIAQYLALKERIDATFPIVENPGL